MLVPAENRIKQLFPFFLFIFDWITVLKIIYCKSLKVEIIEDNKGNY